MCEIRIMKTEDRYLAWIRQGLEPKDKTQSGLARHLGLAHPQISELLRGNRRLKVDEVPKIAAYLGLPPPADIVVPIVGTVQAGGDMIIRDVEEGYLGEAPLPYGADPVHTVAVEVRGDSMGGRIENGDLVYYDSRQDPPTDDLYGKLCVVGLSDGRVMVKKLLKGSRDGLFHLMSFAGDPLFDQEVNWAGRIIWIQPR